MTISATTRGLRPGVCTSTTRPGSPFDGQLIYETDTNRVAVYDTNAWVYKTPASTTGSVLQVLQTVKSDTFSTTSTSFTDVTGLSVSITPTSTSSKILVMVDMKCGTSSTSANMASRLLRGSTAIYIGDEAGSRNRGMFGTQEKGGTYDLWQISGIFLDSPSTTSSTTYKMQIISAFAQTIWVNRTNSDDNNSYGTRSASSITLMEIAG